LDRKALSVATRFPAVRDPHARKLINHPAPSLTIFVILRFWLRLLPLQCAGLHHLLFVLSFFGSWVRFGFWSGVTSPLGGAKPPRHPAGAKPPSYFSKGRDGQFLSAVLTGLPPGFWSEPAKAIYHVVHQPLVPRQAGFRFRPPTPNPELPDYFWKAN
jgi:hypothetical protein